MKRVCIALIFTLVSVFMAGCNGTNGAPGTLEKKQEADKTTYDKENDVKPNLSTNNKADEKDSTIKNKAEKSETPSDDSKWREAFCYLVSEVTESDYDLYETPCYYYVYDIDKDGIPELIVERGIDEATYHGLIYKYDIDTQKTVNIGEIGMGHTGLSTYPNGNGIIQYMAHMGGQVIYKISIGNGSLTTEELFSENIDDDKEYTDVCEIVKGSEDIRKSEITDLSLLKGMPEKKEPGENTEQGDITGKNLADDSTEQYKAPVEKLQKTFCDLLSSIKNEEISLTVKSGVFTDEVKLGKPKEYYFFDIDKNAVPDILVRFTEGGISNKGAIYELMSDWNEVGITAFFDMEEGLIYKLPSGMGFVKSVRSGNRQTIYKCETYSEFHDEEVFSEIIKEGEKFTDVEDVIEGSILVKETSIDDFSPIMEYESDHTVSVSNNGSKTNKKDVQDSSYSNSSDNDPNEISKGKRITVDDDTRYKMNVFLSNFSEAYLFDYDYDDIDWPSLCRWAYIWCRINKPDYIEYETRENDYYKVSVKNINSITNRYLQTTISDAEIALFPNRWEGMWRSFIKDGYYYENAADGETYTEFSLIDHVEEISDGRLKVYFKHCSIDLEAFGDYDYKIPKRIYTMTLEEAEKSPELNIGVDLDCAIIDTYTDDAGNTKYYLLKLGNRNIENNSSDYKQD